MGDDLKRLSAPGCMEGGGVGGGIGKGTTGQRGAVRGAVRGGGGRGAGGRAGGGRAGPGRGGIGRGGPGRTSAELGNVELVNVQLGDSEEDGSGNGVTAFRSPRQSKTKRVSTGRSGPGGTTTERVGRGAHGGRGSPPQGGAGQGEFLTPDRQTRSKRGKLVPHPSGQNYRRRREDHHDGEQKQEKHYRDRRQDEERGQAKEDEDESNDFVQYDHQNDNEVSEESADDAEQRDDKPRSMNKKRLDQEQYTYHQGNAGNMLFPEHHSYYRFGVPGAFPGCGMGPWYAGYHQASFYASPGEFHHPPNDYYYDDEQDIDWGAPLSKRSYHGFQQYDGRHREEYHHQAEATLAGTNAIGTEYQQFPNVYSKQSALGHLAAPSPPEMQQYPPAIIKQLAITSAASTSTSSAQQQRQLLQPMLQQSAADHLDAPSPPEIQQHPQAMIEQQASSAASTSMSSAQQQRQLPQAMLQQGAVHHLVGTAQVQSQQQAPLLQHQSTHGTATAPMSAYQQMQQPQLMTQQGMQGYPAGPAQDSSSQQQAPWIQQQQLTEYKEENGYFQNFKKTRGSKSLRGGKPMFDKKASEKKLNSLIDKKVKKEMEKLLNSRQSQPGFCTPHPSVAPYAYQQAYNHPTYNPQNSMHPRATGPSP